MVLATVDAYGAPSFGTRKGSEAIVFHTPENPSIDLASAIAIANWQATPQNTARGSYHGIMGHRGSDNPASCTTEDHWVMVRSVPWNLSAGGLSTNRDPAVWQPGRYPWIKAGMSAGGYADPNAYCQQIALSGRTAWYLQNGYPPGLLSSLARWVKTLEGAYRYDALLTSHLMWQTNRSDPGAKAADLIFARYKAMFLAPPAPAPAPAPAPTPPPPPSPTELELARRAIAGLEGRIAGKNELIDDAITALQAARAK